MLQTGESNQYEHVVSIKDQKNFGETFEDFTYLHYNDDYARRCGFRERPIQGALISAIIVKDIVLSFGDSAILRSHNLTFMRPIYPNESFIIELFVISNIKNKAIKIRTRVIQNDMIHYQGETKIKAFDDIQESYFKDKKYKIQI
jgi:acyl dehydratase